MAIEKYFDYVIMNISVDESIIFLSKMWEEHHEKQAIFSPTTS